MRLLNALRPHKYFFLLNSPPTFLADYKKTNVEKKIHK